VRVCGNDYGAVAGLCALREAGETRLTPERVRDIMLGIRCAPRRRRLTLAAEQSFQPPPNFAPKKVSKTGRGRGSWRRRSRRLPRRL
jgi:hypothetical protein